MQAQVKSFDLSTQAQAVWAEKDVEAKRTKCVALINGMRFKAKIPEFLRVAANANAQRLDRLASDLMLCDTDKVIKVNR